MAGISSFTVYHVYRLYRETNGVLHHLAHLINKSYIDEF